MLKVLISSFSFKKLQFNILTFWFIFQADNIFNLYVWQPFAFTEPKWILPDYNFSKFWFQKGFCRFNYF